MSPSSSAARLLRLYPPAWRQRYGEEFLATVGDGGLHPQQWIDIVSGALDAWLSADVRRAVAAERLGERQADEARGGTMVSRTMICGDPKMRLSTRDGLIGAAAMLALTLLFSVLGIAAKRQGWEISASILLMLSFPGSLVLTMPLTFLKGQPWRAQVALMGATLAILIVIAYFAARF